MTIKRYIAGLLLICFSAFLGHNLVPHHHHSEVFYSPIATDCPYEHGDHQGHDHESDADTDAENHPIHCHAFNDVVFEKYNAPLIKSWTSQTLVALFSNHTIVPEAPLVIASKLFTFLKLPCSSHTEIGTRALRAPPALA